MSRHTHMFSDDSLFVYGLDLPTAGYFYQHIDQALGELLENDGIMEYEDGLTLSSLLKLAKEKYDLDISPRELISDYLRAESPSPLQYNVSFMFGVDLRKKLELLDSDMFANYGEYMNV